MGFLLVSVVLPGCYRQDSIVRHEIPKDRSGLDHLREAADRTSTAVSAEANGDAQSSESKEDDRMVVALALRDDATWFFKLNGPVSRIDETESQWRPFLKSISFDEAGKPKWSVPEDWKVGGEKPMRFATLVIDASKPPVELAVSSLSAGQDLLLNVNRWRGQLGLEPTTESALKDSLTKVQADGQELTLFDATGKMSGGMMPPFARAGGPASGRPNSPLKNSAGNKISFTAPDGWEPGKPSPFLKARFSKTDEDQTAQISVSSLPASANKWVPNAVRWAGQVGMSSMDETALTEVTESVTVDGQEGKLIRLIPDDAKQEKATIAAMVKKGSDAWFFKLTGDRELVGQNDQVLVDFLKTVKLP